MILDITGKIIRVLDLQTGTSANGDWKKQEFILETNEQYSRKICIYLWGDKINDIIGIPLGKELITVSVDLESREYNGRWYTGLRATDIKRTGKIVEGGVNVAATATAAFVAEPIGNGNDTNNAADLEDDLPF
jgi:hypothetical protein